MLSSPKNKSRSRRHSLKPRIYEETPSRRRHSLMHPIYEKKIQQLMEIPKSRRRSRMERPSINIASLQQRIAEVINFPNRSSLSRDRRRTTKMKDIVMAIETHKKHRSLNNKKNKNKENRNRNSLSLTSAANDTHFQKYKKVQFSNLLSTSKLIKRLCMFSIHISILINEPVMSDLSSKYLLEISQKIPFKKWVL